MEHVKVFHQVEHHTKDETIFIEGPISPSTLEKYHFHQDLTSFRPATKQYEAILGIAELPEGRIIIARIDNTIIGYVTYLYPDPLERWSTFQMKELLELGAIEVIPEFRGSGIASKLLKVSMMDNFMENYIIISTEYYWHWDLKGTYLSVWQYRKIMEKMMASGGLSPSPTDDPEIISHPANCLMVRIGKNISEETIKQFEKLRFLKRYQLRDMREGL